jgi:L-alanine-DL-glutamate epimerase-like enolase superfamily enzyme
MRKITITAVEVLAVQGPVPDGTPGFRQGQAKLIHAYAEHRPGSERVRSQPGPQSGPRHREALYLRIGTDSDVEGFYGPVDREAAWPIVDMLAGFLVGQDALAGTIVWDKLYRLDRHARHGHLKMAVSAVDNCLWDLRGKAFDAPVHQLLGGPSRERIPAYASTLGTSHDPADVQSVAEGLVKEGYAAQKWFLAHGPGEGADGLARNVELAGRVRAAVGSGTRLMFDAFMGWDLAHARDWARQVEGLAPSWLEEPFSPTQYPAFVELHRATRVPLAAGEHLYDRADVLPYLRDGTLTALQCDPEWCGGVTELVRITALAESFGVPVIPHGHGVHAALHVVASQSPATCPMVEYLFLAMPGRYQFERNPPAPEGGSVAVPTAPGFGIELDPARVASTYLWTGAAQQA